MKTYLICLPLLLMAAAPAGAQVVSGTVQGTYGAGVPQASVTVANDEDVVIAHRFTDRSGRFTVQLPVAGLYYVRVTADDFEPITRTVRVRDNASTSTRVQLRQRGVSTPDMRHRDLTTAGGIHKERAPGGGASGSKPAGREN